MAIAERISRIEASLVPDPSHGVSPQTILQRMSALRVPGYSLAVINQYGVEWVKGYGLMEAGRPEPVTPHTRFQACSVSKPVAVVTAMVLVERGLLDLDADVNRYLKRWRVPANGPWQPRITLRHLMSHTAGATVHGFPGYPRHDAVPTTLGVLNGEGNTRPVCIDTLPGVHFRYSGGGITALQMVLEDATATGFADLVQELVFDPLGMQESAYGQPETAGEGGLAATGHRPDGAPLPQRYHRYPELAAAGLWTTPSDLALLAVDLMCGRAGKPCRLLRPDTVAAMLTRQFGAITGLGWFLPMQGMFGHEGDNEGFKADLSANWQTGQGAVLMGNGDAAWRLHPEVLGAIAREYEWPAFAFEPPAAWPAPPVARRSYSAPAPVGTPEERLHRFTRQIPRAGSLTGETMTLAELLTELSVPGCSIAVVAGGEIEWARGFGVRRAGTDEPVTAETLFQAGGLSRTVAAVVTLRLVERGLLDLDSDIRRWLKRWQLPADGGAQAVVTIRQLLSHNAGLTTHEFAGYRAGEPLPTLRQVLDGAAPAGSPPIRVIGTPGARPQFAESGFVVLQQLLEDATGRPFGALAQELVFEPLGMTQSLFAATLPEHMAGQAAAGHWRMGEPVAGRWFRYPELAANGLWSTPSDLARLVMELQRARQGRSTLLSQAMATDMLTAQNEANFGLGVSLREAGQSHRFQQSFSTAGFSGFLVGQLDGELGAVIMMNHSWGFWREELLATLTDTYGFALSEQEAYLRTQQERTAGAPLPLAALRQLAGEYEAGPDLRLRVTVKEGALLLEPMGQPPLILVHAADERFFAAHLVLSVTFVRDQAGGVIGLTLHQNQNDLYASRQA